MSGKLPVKQTRFSVFEELFGIESWTIDVIITLCGYYWICHQYTFINLCLFAEKDLIVMIKIYTGVFLNVNPENN